MTNTTNTAGVDVALDNLEALVREYGNAPLLGTGRTRAAVMADIRKLARRSTSGSDATCMHEFHYFGDQPERRCVHCNKVESVAASGSDGTAADLAAKLRVAVDAEYPIPDNPHASVIQRATDNRAAMWRGINAARRLIGDETTAARTADMLAALRAFGITYDDEIPYNTGWFLTGDASAFAKAEDAANERIDRIGAVGLLNAKEMAALRRFNETCEDGEEYDVPKPMMQRLAKIGVIRRTSGSHYEITDFGMHVLDAAPAPAAAADQRAGYLGTEKN